MTKQTTINMIKNNQTTKERVETLEGVLLEVIPQINKMFAEINQRNAEQAAKVREVSDVLQAVISVAGPEAVAAKYKELADQTLTARALTQQEEVAKALQDNKIKPVDAISPDSIIAFTEARPDGTLMGATGYTRYHYRELLQEVQEALLGKSRDFEYKTQSGGSLKVLDIYEPVAPVAVEEAPQEEAK